jgi:hypothetical protein
VDEKILQRKLYWKKKNIPKNEYDEKKANNEKFLGKHTTFSEKSQNVHIWTYFAQESY